MLCINVFLCLFVIMLFLFGGVSSSSWCTCKRKGTNSSHVRGIQFFTPRPPSPPPTHTQKKNKKKKNKKNKKKLKKSQVTGVTNTYQFFTRQKLSNEFFTCVRNWYQFFTPEKKSRQFFTGVTNTYQFFTRQKLSTWEIWAQILDPKIYRNWPYVNFTFGKCDVLVPVLLMGVKFMKWEIYGSTELCYAVTMRVL